MNAILSLAKAAAPSQVRHMARLVLPPDILNGPEPIPLNIHCRDALWRSSENLLSDYGFTHHLSALNSDGKYSSAQQNTIKIAKLSTITYRGDKDLLFFSPDLPEDFSPPERLDVLLADLPVGAMCEVVNSLNYVVCSSGIIDPATPFELGMSIYKKIIPASFPRPSKPFSLATELAPPIRSALLRTYVSQNCAFPSANIVPKDFYQRPTVSSNSIQIVPDPIEPTVFCVTTIPDSNTIAPCYQLSFLYTLRLLDGTEIL